MTQFTQEKANRLLCREHGTLLPDTAGANLLDAKNKLFWIVDIETQESSSLPWGYGLVRKTLPLPLGTYARIGRGAD